jgi:hypothetical protein
MKSHLSERLARPPRILSMVAALWLLWILEAYSDTGVGITGLFALMYGGGALALAWVVRGGVFFLVRRRSAEAPRAAWRWWITVPVALAIACAIFPFEGPRNPLFQLRFRFSKTALTRYAERLLAASSTESSNPRRVGLFRAIRTEAHDRQVRFITTPCGVIDACGLVYSPFGEPRRWQEDRFSRLDGPWWHVYEGF